MMLAGVLMKTQIRHCCAPRRIYPDIAAAAPPANHQQVKMDSGMLSGVAIETSLGDESLHFVFDPFSLLHQQILHSNRVP